MVSVKKFWIVSHLMDLKIEQTFVSPYLCFSIVLYSQDEVMFFEVQKFNLFSLLSIDYCRYYYYGCRNFDQSSFLHKNENTKARSTRVIKSLYVFFLIRV